MTDESVMSIGRMVGDLTLLTHLNIDINDWKCLSDRSMKVISDSISNLNSLTHLYLDLFGCSGSE
jgi:hypothetical protein